MFIFTSAEENNAALVSGKVTRRFPLIFSGATFPIRLLLVKWRDEPLKMLSFLGDPKGNPKKLNIFKGEALHRTSKSRMGNVKPENLSWKPSRALKLTKAELFYEEGGETMLS